MGKPGLGVPPQYYKNKVGYHMGSSLECGFDLMFGNNSKWYLVICIINLIVLSK